MTYIWGITPEVGRRKEKNYKTQCQTVSLLTQVHTRPYQIQRRIPNHCTVWHLVMYHLYLDKNNCLYSGKSHPITRFTMHKWNNFLSGSSYAKCSSSFSIFLIISSASSFCEVMMYETQRFARTIALTFKIWNKNHITGVLSKPKCKTGAETQTE